MCVLLTRGSHTGFPPSIMRVPLLKDHSLPKGKLGLTFLVLYEIFFERRLRMSL